MTFVGGGIVVASTRTHRTNSYTHVHTHSHRGTETRHKQTGTEEDTFFFLLNTLEIEMTGQKEEEEDDDVDERYSFLTCLVLWKSVEGRQRAPAHHQLPPPTLLPLKRRDGTRRSRERERESW